MRPPTIVTYEYLGANGHDAPDHMMFAAAMVPDKRAGTHWIATGATAEEAEGKLLAMWKRQYPDAPKRAPKEASEPPEDVDIVL